MAHEIGRKPLVVVTGQIPPPTGGQNVMIQRIVEELVTDTRWHMVHLPFYFTPSFQSVRRFRVGKIIELFAVWWRFACLLAAYGRPDILLYPSGGPQTVPVVRDILLLPLFCALSRKVIVQFHAAGIADRLAEKSGLIEKVLRFAYRGVSGAIVMTDFNRKDPLALGIHSIEVIPHRLPDENPEGHLPDYSGFLSDTSPDSVTPFSSSNLPPSTFRILYVGHLYDLKGTPQLVEAFAEIAPKHPQTKLVLMGEFLPPYTEDMCRARCRELGIEDRVEIAGLLRGKKKAAQFRAAHLFVFPSVAPYESFGLVLAEAMMWGLPIVASEWRGNRNVAGSEAVYCQTHDSQTLSRLGGCLLTMLSDLQKLPHIAETSRGRYESHYRLGDRDGDYCDVVDRWLCSNCRF